MSEAGDPGPPPGRSDPAAVMLLTIFTGAALPRRSVPPSPRKSTAPRPNSVPSDRRASACPRPAAMATTSASDDGAASKVAR